LATLQVAQHQTEMAQTSDQDTRCVDIQVMPACKRRVPALPVLTYPNVRSAPVLGTHRFRLGLT
ncbi:MAG: hypothetical protein E5Y31_30325, partial [Mesorhizobium sp.]